MKNILITGGAGFIGANFVKYVIKNNRNYNICVLDKLTYAGNTYTIKDEMDKINFIKGDIVNKELVEYIFDKYEIDTIINFAAESHVDRSIEGPEIFFETNVLGTGVLLNTAKKKWEIGERKYKEGVKYLQVSTDEVYGSLGETGYFTEETPLDPRSPYSASKTGADMIVKSYHDTYNMPVNITRCSNNYGPYHYPEKLIPLTIQKVLKGENIPVYGDGKNIRDWLYVEDHCGAIEMVALNGKDGEVYNIGGHNERENIFIVKMIINTIREFVEKDEKYKKILKTDVENINEGLIKFVKDRLGHDKRYAIDPLKIGRELGWKPETKFEDGIKKTVEWYINNQEWVKTVSEK